VGAANGAELLGAEAQISGKPQGRQGVKRHGPNASDVVMVVGILFPIDPYASNTLTTGKITLGETWSFITLACRV
jgi:hypothetical protein